MHGYVFQARTTCTTCCWIQGALWAQAKCVIMYHSNLFLVRTIFNLSFFFVSFSLISILVSVLQRATQVSISLVMLCNIRLQILTSCIACSGSLYHWKNYLVKVTSQNVYSSFKVRWTHDYMLWWEFTHCNHHSTILSTIPSSYI